MAKHNYALLQEEFNRAAEDTGIGLEKWCEAKGLKYGTVKRHIKSSKAAKTSTATKAAEQSKTVRKERKKVRKDLGLHTQSAQVLKIAHFAVQELERSKRYTKMQKAFFLEYIKDLNLKRAAEAAGYKDARPLRDLIRSDHARKLIEGLLAGKYTEPLAAAEQYTIQLYEELNADYREFSELHNVACRHCHGEGHRYQWISLEEFEYALEEWERENGHKEPKDQKAKPSDSGGFGYDPVNSHPVSTCFKCHGNGVSKIVLHDTRELTPAAARLYEGVKQGKNGIEMQLVARKDIRSAFVTMLTTASAHSLKIRELEAEARQFNNDHMARREERAEEKHQIGMMLAKVQIRTLAKAGGGGSVNIKLVNAYKPPGAVEPDSPPAEESNETE